ncbi:MAG: nucleotide pyrophosphohydrolase [Chitinophagaceae bacterium]|nr:nucleotide pyrophosphohydrolase [Chitinophagaceae bacterium]
MITIEQAQQKVDEWIKTKGVRYFTELTNMAILTEEVGELARHIARLYGEQSYKKEEAPKSPDESKQILADEMADILWVLLCLANQTGINLTEALKRNFAKKNSRDHDRHLKNEKLIRKQKE